MSPIKIEQALSELYEQWAGEAPELVLPLAPSGSERIYYRLQSRHKPAIGAYNPNPCAEPGFSDFLQAFFCKRAARAKHLCWKTPPKTSICKKTWALLRYTATSFKKLDNTFPDYLYQVYKKTVEQLARLQIEGHEGRDYTVCATHENPLISNLCCGTLTPSNTAF